ncbi:hypothetical protein P8452_54871 [Trifolium repens]|nr:hypothetical protein P8452_54871 [Trifolium repens]
MSRYFCQKKKKCPVTILQNGLPVKFTIPNKSNGIIMIGTTEFDIEFTKKPNCVESSKWLIELDYEQHIFQLVIGVPETDPEMPLGGTFYIEKYGNAYKIVFCLDDLGEYICKDVVRWKDFKDGESRLVVVADHLQDPYSFLFVDAPSFC